MMCGDVWRFVCMCVTCMGCLDGVLEWSYVSKDQDSSVMKLPAVARPHRRLLESSLQARPHQKLFAPFARPASSSLDHGQFRSTRSSKLQRGAVLFCDILLRVIY